MKSCKRCYLSKEVNGTLYCRHTTTSLYYPIEQSDYFQFARFCQFYYISELDRILFDEDYKKNVD